MDPRGDGTIREGDELWAIFQKAMEGNTVIGNRQESGEFELQVFPIEGLEKIEPSALIPESALPSDLTEEQRARVEEKLAADQHALPSTPGEYLDRTGDPWTLNGDGTWTDKHGTTKPIEWTPLVVIFGPMIPADRG